MQIILKPGGVALTFAGIGALATLAVVNFQRGARRDVLPTHTVSTNNITPKTPISHSNCTLIEAESLGLGTVRADGSASGGKYVHVVGEYEPLAIATVPRTGDAFTVWARVRRTDAQLKGEPGGTQKEYEWNYESPVAFRWVRVGRHTRPELGKRVMLIRGEDNNEAENDGIDALLFAPDDAMDPNRDLKEG